MNRPSATSAVLDLAGRWRRLLSTERLSRAAPPAHEERSPFERDMDRIIFAPAFRRLADRTQVLPAPQDDHVHSRLTHSLEVSTLGRSLGTRVGEWLGERGGLPAALTPKDLGDCVGAACLIHDLGNPPYGHAGEEAIREFFAGPEGQGAMSGLDERQRQDLLCFEGNAQSLRLAMRTARPKGKAGLDLCLATLGALVKYPCASTAVDRESGRASTKKHGVHADEDASFERVALGLGLEPRPGARAWARHPLVFLTEAADDITYAVVDLEDAMRLGLLSAAEFAGLLRPFATGHARVADELERPGLDRESMFELAGKLRSDAITSLLQGAAVVFEARHDEILAGTFDAQLMKHIETSEAFAGLTRVARKRYYRARDVLRMEITGAVAIQGVLSALTEAASGSRSVRASNLRTLMPWLAAGATGYDRLLAITDHVSGMTDGYVLRQYHELTGGRLPGGRH